MTGAFSISDVSATGFALARRRRGRFGASAGSVVASVSGTALCTVPGAASVVAVSSKFAGVSDLDTGEISFGFVSSTTLAVRRRRGLFGLGSLSSRFGCSVVAGSGAVIITASGVSVVSIDTLSAPLLPTPSSILVS